MGVCAGYIFSARVCLPGISGVPGYVPSLIFYGDDELGTGESRAP